MTSKAELIVDAVVAALTTPAMSSVPAARVFRDLDDALRVESFPAVAVELGDEQSPQRVLIGRMDRMLDVRVHVMSKAATSSTSPLTAGDAALVESFDRIMADRGLGGLALDVVEGATARQRAGLGEHVALVTKTYTVHYRTTETSLVS